MAHHTFHIELDLKPTDENYGNDLEEEQTLLQEILQRDVPWTYSRMHVPKEFARNGIGLELWRRAVDSASQLWKDRTVALATPAQAAKRICTTLAVFVVSIPFITLTILISSMDRSGYLPEWSGFVIIGAIVSFIVSIAVVVSVNRTFIHQYTNVLSEFEQKWSSLAQDLNAEYELRGVKVETVRKHVLKRQRRFAWTVGLGFQFRMQPVDDEEVAWCISNSQTSDVEDDAYQDRKLRVIKETPLSHDGVDVVLGDQQSGVAVAIAVVDEVDVENSSDMGSVNEKAALLHLV
ncbi:hypothetical protein MHU86_13011 [Fragilaria crotonensis]|nr:hypothetical protein MHU86_13011 [Fragilaria crotonensis]